MAYRFGRWLTSQPVPIRWGLKPFYLWMFRRVRMKWGIELNHEADIGPGFLIFHYGGIFVGSRVVIGANCSISHDVTIGLSGRGPRRGAPRLGDNVYVAPGANISGKIEVGANSRIGANVVLDRSVPAGSLVQMPSPRIVAFPSLYNRAPEAGLPPAEG
jgi:serine O-acetyltransferase